MNAALSLLTSGVLAQADRIYSPPAEDDASYFELLERNTHILYPLLTLLAVTIIIAGILQAWRAQDIDGLAKVELKREIILELRRHLGGLSAEHIAKVIGVESFKTQKLLEEMLKDGILICHTNTQRLTLWRLKGVGAARSGS